MTFRDTFLLWLLLLSSIIGSNASFAQTLGRNPNQQNWQEVESRILKLHFPQGTDSAAQKVLQLINRQFAHRRAIGEKSKNLSIFLHNQTMEANSYVGLAPFRSEFYGTPPTSFRSLGSTDWLDLLTIHEYRHVLQYSNSLNGVTKFGYWLFGEGGWSLFQQMALPNWYFEGDAVISETAFSESGRGRIPYFTLQQRAIALNNIKYRYHKIRNGSFKDLVPSHYQWGYTLLSHLVNQSGDSTLAETVKEATAYKKIFYPFSRSMKENSGFTTKNLYDSAWQASTNLWRNRLQNRTFTKGRALTDTNLSTPTFYYFPQLTEKGDLLAWKSSYKETDAIVKLENGKEKVVAKPGYNLDQYFHYQDSQLVWTEYNLNYRRSRQQFSNVILFDLKSEKKIPLTKKGRYFSPILSKDNRFVYAIRFNLDFSCEIVKIKKSDHEIEVIQSFPNTEYVSRLAETEKGDLIFIRRKESKIAIFSLSLRGSRFTQLTPWTAHTIDDIRVSDNFVYFSASFNQIDNIYRSPLNGSKTVQQLTSSKTGSYHPFYSLKNQKLFYTEGILNGFKVTAAIDSDLRKSEVEVVEPKQQKWQLQQTQNKLNLTALPASDSVNFAPKPYRGLLRGLRLHSWPITATPAQQEINLEFDNYLNEISASVGGGFNLNEEASFYQAQISYGKFLPVFSLSAISSFRNYDFLGSDDYLYTVDSRQNTYALNSYIPIQKLYGNYAFNARPSVSISLAEVEAFDSNGNFSLASTALSLSYLKRTARQNLAPRLGFSGSVNYSRNIEQLSDERFSINGRVYLPSFFANHSLQISSAYRFELLSNLFQRRDQFVYSRGFSAPLNDEYYRFSVDYALPLLYPDWGFLGISYFKRIRANFFYDYGERQIDRFNINTNYQSAGVELMLDNVWLNIAEITLGARASYLLTEDPTDPNQDWVPGFFIQTSF